MEGLAPVQKDKRKKDETETLFDGMLLGFGKFVVNNEINSGRLMNRIAVYY